MKIIRPIIRITLSIGVGLAVFCLTSAGVAYAGIISLTASTTCRVSEEGVVVTVAMINTGDEPARDLIVAANCLGGESLSEIHSRLEPKHTWTVDLILDPKPPLPGAYAVPVTITFHDSAGRPFSAMSYTTFSYEEAVDNRVLAQPSTTVLHRWGELTLDVVNTDSEGREVTVRLIAPREIMVEPQVKALSLPAGESLNTRFKLRNLSARDGAEYPLLVLTTYENKGMHFESVAEARVRVERIGKYFKRNSLLFIGLALVLIVVTAVQAFMGRRSGRDVN